MTELADINVENMLKYNPELVDLLPKEVRRRETKYHNVPAQLEGITYQSGEEARYAQLLLSRYRSGEILNLERQVRFKLPGKTTYVADWVFIELGKPLKVVVMDKKGKRTEAYQIKKRQMWEVYGIEITEV